MNHKGRRTGPAEFIDNLIETAAKPIAVQMAPGAGVGFLVQNSGNQACSDSKGQ
jgi:hypothetical protein